jgi:hypothetical protein
VKVFFTTDVEVWCDGWTHLDNEFSTCFDQYVYGRTPTGDYGLPFQARMLGDRGLTGVFFVEPLFSTHFGKAPLDEIVGLISEQEQDIELHLHPEWLDESLSPLLKRQMFKRKNIRDFTRAEQSVIIGAAKALLERSVGDKVTAFRAGNFGFDRDTLVALRDNGILFDSSYNRTINRLESRLEFEQDIQFPQRIEGVWEYPLTVFRDGFGKERHLQLTACSLSEMKSVLMQSAEMGLDNVNILSHNFELLDASKTRVEPVVLRRFEGLCDFLANNKDTFRVEGFRKLDPKRQTHQSPAPIASAWGTARRYVEQVSMRAHR